MSGIGLWAAIFATFFHAIIPLAFWYADERLFGRSRRSPGSAGAISAGRDVHALATRSQDASIHQPPPRVRDGLRLHLHGPCLYYVICQKGQPRFLTLPRISPYGHDLHDLQYAPNRRNDPIAEVSL